MFYAVHYLPAFSQIAEICYKTINTLYSPHVEAQRFQSTKDLTKDANGFVNVIEPLTNAFREA